MPDQPGPGPKKPSDPGRIIGIATAVGTIIGAFLARPVLRPWLMAHTSDFKIGAWLVASFVPWIAFSLYWEMQAKNSAPAVSSESKASRSVHVILTNLALLLVIVPFRPLTQRFLPDLLFVRIAGLILECAGLSLAIWARSILGRNWSGEITIKEDHELVRSGPYATVRHPIYTALLVMYTGTAIVSGQIHALLGLLVAIIAYLRKTRMEEANLVIAFGTRYDQYREETWAIVPGIY